MADHDLAEVVAGIHPCIRGFGVAEVEHTVDHWLDRMLCHERVEGFEVRARADEDARDARVTRNQGGGRDVAAEARQATDDGDMAARRHARQRLRERAGAPTSRMWCAPIPPVASLSAVAQSGVVR